MESTYGDRCMLRWRREGEAGGAGEERAGARWHMIVPAFAVERTQQLVLLLHEMIERRRFRLPIFVDSRWRAR